MTFVVPEENEARIDRIKIAPWSPDPMFIMALQTAESCETVATAGEYARAAALIRDLKRYKRECDGHFKPITQAIDAVKGTVLGMRAAAFGPIDAQIARLERMAVEWKTRRERAEADLQRKGEEEARRMALAERAEKIKALEAVAKMIPGVTIALTAEKEALLAAPLVPEAVKVASEVPKVAGFSTTQRRRVRQVSLGILIKAVAEGRIPEDVLMVNNARLNDYVQQMGDAFDFPGVELEKVTGVIGR